MNVYLTIDRHRLPVNCTGGPINVSVVSKCCRNVSSKEFYIFVLEVEFPSMDALGPQFFSRR